MLSRLLAVSLIVLALSMVFGSAASIAQERCQEILFAPGESSGTIEGAIPPDGELCFAIKTGQGQNAAASIDGPEAQFPVIMIDGLTADGGEQSVSWLTQARSYELRVMTLFRYGADTPFRLQVSVTGG